jgi:hypothetical protein
MVGAERENFFKLGPLDRRKHLSIHIHTKHLGNLASLELNLLRSVQQNVWKFI